jgi:hypothetical protein
MTTREDDCWRMIPACEDADIELMIASGAFGMQVRMTRNEDRSV